MYMYVVAWLPFQIDEDLAKINIDDPKYQLREQGGAYVSGVSCVLSAHTPGGVCSPGRVPPQARFLLAAPN